MKTLHIFHHSNLVNGVDRTTCTLIAALLKLGVTPTAVVPKKGDVTDFLSANKVAYHITPYSCCQSLARRAQLRFLADSSEQQKKLLSFINKVSPDVIHINTGHLLHAGLAAAQLKIPAIWHIHSPFEHDLTRYQKAVGQAGYSWLLENLSSMIIGVSKDVSASLAEHIPADKITTLYNGIDVDKLIEQATTEQTNIRQELGLSLDGKLIIGVGRISEQKNFASFARVAKLVSLQHPNTFFLIAGPEQDTAAVNLLKSEINRLQLTDKIFLLGPRLDVPALVAQSDCFLSTAIFEGQGIAALEAMTLEKPVVAMACTGLRECIVDQVDGMLVGLDDEKMAAEQISQIIGSPELASKLGKNGKQSVLNRFSSTEYAKRFLDIAEKALQSGPAPATPNSLAVINGLLGEINFAHQRLLELDKETFLQQCKRAIWKVIYQIKSSRLH